MNRIGGFAGPAFAVLYFVAIFGIMDLPEGADSDAEVLDLVSGDGRNRLIAGVALLAAAGVLFLWFVATLVEQVRVRGDGVVLRLVLLAGTVFTTMLFVAGACFGVVPLASALNELPDGTAAETARVLTQLGFVSLLLFGLAAAGTMVLAVSIGALGSGALPTWLAWSGIAIGPLLFLGAFWMPQLLLLLWAAVTGVVIARGPRPTASELV